MELKEVGRGKGRDSGERRERRYYLKYCRHYL
jgi:hypothetical protein